MDFFKIIIFALLLFSHGAWACDEVQWLYNTKPIGICYDEKSESFISASCFKAKKKCWAGQASKRAKELQLSRKSNNEYVINVGYKTCQFLGGKTRQLKTPTGDENTFCQGPDGTLVDINSL